MLSSPSYASPNSCLPFITTVRSVQLSPFFRLPAGSDAPGNIFSCNYTNTFLWRSCRIFFHRLLTDFFHWSERSPSSCTHSSYISLRVTLAVLLHLNNLPVVHSVTPKQLTALQREDFASITFELNTRSHHESCEVVAVGYESSVHIAISCWGRFWTMFNNLTHITLNCLMQTLVSFWVICKMKCILWKLVSK